MPSAPSSPDPAALDRDAVQRLLVEGQELAIAGRLEEAEATLRRALALTRGTGDPTESRACGNLGTFYGIHNRAFEALLLYRRGLRIDRERGDWRLVAHHLANIAGICGMLGLDDRLPDLMAQVDEAIERLDGKPRLSAERVALWPRFLHAVAIADLDGAQHLLDRIRREHAGFKEPRVHANVGLLTSRLRQREGDAAGALAALDAALQVDGISETTRLDLLTSRVRVLEALDRRDEARADAIDALERLERLGGRESLAEQCIDVGAVLAERFAVGECPVEYARRAYDVAAASILERIRQLDACLRDLPELTEVTSEDHAWFGDLREEFTRRQSALLERVGALLDEARRAGDFPIFEPEETGGFVRLCAWCCTVRTREGRWLPVAHFIPVETGVRVTHSICGSCAERVRRS